MRPRYLLPLLLATIVPARAPSQTAARPASPPVTAEWVMEQQARERWMHGGQRPPFTPYSVRRQWVMVDSIRESGGGRALYFSYPATSGRRSTTLAMTGPAGRLLRFETYAAGAAPIAGLLPEDTLRIAERARSGEEAGLMLAGSRAWDIVPTMPPTVARVGARWTDTLARDAAEGPAHQTLRGTRTSWITGDTLVRGRRLWIVRDSAGVEYEERYLERERTLDTTVQEERHAVGTVRGVHLLDDSLGLYRHRADTTVLRGEAVLRYPDGRTFRTPATFERTRVWDLHDTAQYAARIVELRAGAMAQRGGMVTTPDGTLQRRLAQGDVAARDSVLDAWRDATDPDVRAALYGLVRTWIVRTDADQAQVDSLALAVGDSSLHYQMLARRAYGQGAPDSAGVRAMLPYMEDPSLAWALGRSRDWLYENLVQGLTTWPPAAARNSRRIGCLPGACRLLGEQWRRAREPRLRDVALVALVTQSPRQWADTVLSLAGPHHPLLRGAAQLVRGVGATWPASSHASIPAPGSGWRDWLEWMDGRDPRYFSRRRVGTSLPDRFAADTLPRVRFEESHAVAMRFHAALTGRDVVAELRRQYVSAASDSARLVFGSMLRGLGEPALGEAEIVAALRSGVPARMDLARDAMLSEFARASTLVGGDVATPFVDRLLSAVMDSAPLWPQLGGERESIRGRRTLAHHAASVEVFLLRDSLPEAVRGKWAARVPLLSGDEWKERDPRTASVLCTISPVRRWGSFVKVEVTLWTRGGRAPGDAVAQFASQNSYYLMATPAGWVIVAEDAWVT